jgi:glycosyltransferase involved in cell wall biosynthesis
MVNALSARAGGGLTHIEQQLQALEEVRPDLQLLVLASPSNEEPLKRLLRSAVVTVRAPNLAFRLIYEQVVLPRARADCRLLYCPGNFCPIARTDFPIVLTIQNAIHFGSGSRAARPSFRQRAEIALARASVKRADVVLAVSETLRSLVAQDGLASDKLKVLRSGTPSWPEAESRPAGVAADADFVLSVANDHPHKQLADLVAACRLMWREEPGAPDLVLVGTVTRDRVHQLSVDCPPQRLKFLGPINSRAELKWLMKNARVLVSTSSIESFGLTLVEAASVGCPVIATDIPAHREVAAAASFVPVGDPVALADRLLNTEPRCSRGGVFPEEIMTWEENARRLADVFDRTFW